MVRPADIPNSIFNPYLILDDRDGINDHGGRGPAILRHGGSWSVHSAFPWRNHWPVNQVQIIGRYAIAADQVSQSYTATQYSAPYASMEKSLTKVMLCGLSDQNAVDLVPLAKSWLRAPALQLRDSSFRSDGFDPAQRAYLLTHLTPDPPARLEFDLDASHESPLHHLCLVVKNWGGTDVRLEIDGQAVTRGTAYRVGHRSTLEGTDLIVWIEQQAERKVRFTLMGASE